MSSPTYGKKKFILLKSRFFDDFMLPEFESVIVLIVKLVISMNASSDGVEVILRAGGEGNRGEE